MKILLVLAFACSLRTSFAEDKKKSQKIDNSDDNLACLEALSDFKEKIMKGGESSHECFYRKHYPGNREFFDFIKDFLLIGDTLKNLDIFKQRLLTSSPDKKEYSDLFYKTVEEDPELKNMIKYLKENNVKLIFPTVQEREICKIGTGFVSPDASEVGMCVKGGKEWGYLVSVFKHEVLHIKQLLGHDLTPDLTFDLNGVKHIGQRMLKYNPSKALSKIHKGNLRVQDASLENKINEFYHLLDDVEKFFYINFSENGKPIFSPKKDVSTSDADFIKDFLNKIIPSGSRSQMRHFVNRAKFPNLIKLLDGKNYQEQSGDVYKNILKILEEGIQKEYGEIASKLSPEQKVTFRSDMEEYYEKDNRYAHGLFLFCMEVQAHMQTQMNSYLNWLKVPRLKGCEQYYSSSNWKVSGTDNIYSQEFLNSKNFNFNEVEKRIEKYVLNHVAFPKHIGIYGAFFSELYGFGAKPEIFNYKNCQNPKID